MHHNFVLQLTFYPLQDKINSYRLTICNHDTVQIRSRYGCHPDTHSDSDFRCSLDTLQTRKPFYFSFRYSSDTLQTRKPFCYLFKFQVSIQYRYTPDTEVILSLIQISNFRYSPDMLQTRIPF